MVSEGKQVHHRCGYVLSVEVLHRFDGVVLVSYRDPARRGLILFMCPQCLRALKLWWDDPTSVEQRIVEGS